ncbi:DUF4249 domain-containing protein [Hymenobacter metallicola]|nr:DUF4249 domain-containing protein [Hymenobacter metallicola]
MSFLAFRPTTMKKPALTLLLSLGLGACETVIDLPEPPHTPRVALQFSLSNYAYTAQNDNDELARTRKLFVSNSQRVFDLSELSGRSDATVVILDEAGTVVEQFRALPPRSPGDVGYYEQTKQLKGEPGRTYTLRASLPGFETVESTLTMPKPAVIESATFTKNAAQSNEYEVRGKLNVSIADDPGANNYYLAFARVVNEQNQQATTWSQVQVDEEDNEFGVEVGQFQLSNIGGLQGYGYGLYPYADTNVNGKRFSLNTGVRYYAGYCPQPTNCNRATYMEVFVTSLTADTYNFYLSRQRYNDTENNPFAEPAPLASNIKGGYGLFGGMMDAVYRIKL